MNRIPLTERRSLVLHCTTEMKPCNAFGSRYRLEACLPVVIRPVRHLKRCALHLYLVVRYRPHITSTSSSSPPLLSFSPPSFPSYFFNPISTPIHGVASVIGTDDDLAEMLEQATELAQMRCDEQRMDAVRHDMDPRERRWIEEARRSGVCTTDIRRSETEEES